MFKVDLKTKKIEFCHKDNTRFPTVEELMPKPGFNIRLKKMKPVKTF